VELGEDWVARDGRVSKSLVWGRYVFCGDNNGMRFCKDFLWPEDTLARKAAVGNCADLERVDGFS